MSNELEKTQLRAAAFANARTIRHLDGEAARLTSALEASRNAGPGLKQDIAVERARVAGLEAEVNALEEALRRADPYGERSLVLYNDEKGRPVTKFRLEYLDIFNAQIRNQNLGVPAVALAELEKGV